MQWLVDAIGSGWAAMLAAWPQFVTAIIAVGVIIWAIQEMMHGTVRRQLEERLKLRDDQIANYKDQLSGATPEEARARIDQLEARVRGRRLTLEQKEKIAAAAAAQKGQCDFQAVLGCIDGVRFAYDLSNAFDAAGWATTYGSTIDDFPIKGGLAVLVENPNNLSPQEQSVISAMRAAALDFEIVGWFRGPQVIVSDPEIVPRPMTRRVGEP